MATLQMTRPKQSQATGTWASVFPAKQETEQQSAQFVKKLLAVAVSNLVYLRALFPERAFGERSVDGLQLKVLRDDQSCPGAWQITQWIKACFDAIDKKYLRQLTVVLYVDPSDPDTAIETYSFRFSYSQAGGVTLHHGEEIVDRTEPANNVTSEDTYKATVRMLRTIVVLTQTLRPLPEDVMMSMKLLYFDDVTPEDYEPSGFRAASTHQVFFSTEPMNVRVGDVATPHHAVKLRLKTDASQFEPPEDDQTTLLASEPVAAAEPEPAAGGERAPVGCHRESGSGAASQATEPEPEPRPADSVCGKSPALPASATAPVDTPAAEPVADGDGDGPEEEPRVHCVCGVHEDDGLMVLCDICRHWQHGICFLVLTEEEAPACHICDACALETGRPCTDPRLPSLPKSTRMATCLYRRGLCACEEMARLQPARLAERLGVDVAVATGLINRLDKDGLLKPTKGRGTSRTVDRDRLFQHAFPRYLNRAAPARPEEPPAAPPPAPQSQGEGGSPAAAMEEGSPAAPVTGAGDGPSPPRRSSRKRTATPKCRPDHQFEVADSQDFAPETVARAGGKRFKASRTDGITP